MSNRSLPIPGELYTWAIRWSVSDLPSEDLTDMHKYSLASTLFDGRSDGIEHIYFNSPTKAERWVKSYIKRCIASNQEYYTKKLVAKYIIYRLMAVETGVVESLISQDRY